MLKEIYEKLGKLEEYLINLRNAYEKTILKKAEIEDLKIRLRHALRKEELSEQERIKAERAYNQLVRAFNAYEREGENLKRRAENVSKEIMKLKKYLPQERRKEIEKEIKFYKEKWGIVSSLFITFIFLAVLNYFRILHKAQEIIGHSVLPTFSFTLFHLLIGAIALFLLIFLLASKRL